MEIIRRYAWAAAAAAVFCGAFLLRAAPEPPAPLRADTDEAQYLRLGRSVADTFALTDRWPEAAAANRGPVFPVFLAVSGKLSSFRLGDIASAQALLNAFCCLLLFWAGARLHSRACGLAAALLFAADPTQARLVQIPMIESFYTFIVLSSACSLIWFCASPSPRRAAGLALALSAGLLCRSSLLFVPLLAAAALALLRPAGWRRSALILLLLSYAFNFAWAARNYHHFRSFSLFEMKALTTASGLFEALFETQRPSSANQGALLAEKMIPGLAGLPPPERDRRMKQALPGLLLRSPQRYLSKSAQRAWSYGLVLRDLAGLPVLLLALLGAWLGRRSAAAATAGLAAYFIAIHSLMTVTTRYMVPLLPVLYLLAARGLLGLYEQLRRLSGLPAAATARPAGDGIFHAGYAFLILLAALSLGVLAADAARAPAGRAALVHDRILPALNEAYFATLSDPAAGAGLYSAVLASGFELSPLFSAAVLADRGWARLQAGDLRGARADLGASVETAPGVYYEAYLNLARVELRLGRAQRAAAALDDALALAQAAGEEFTCEDASLLAQAAVLRAPLQAAPRRPDSGLPAAVFARALTRRYGDRCRGIQSF